MDLGCTGKLLIKVEEEHKVSSSTICALVPTLRRLPWLPCAIRVQAEGVTFLPQAAFGHVYLRAETNPG